MELNLDREVWRATSKAFARLRVRLMGASPSYVPTSCFKLCSFKICHLEGSIKKWVSLPVAIGPEVLARAEPNGVPSI